MSKYRIINQIPSVCPQVSHKDLSWTHCYTKYQCSGTNIQMYKVIYAHGSSMRQVAKQLTNSMVHVTAWLKQCCLQLNMS